LLGPGVMAATATSVATPRSVGVIAHPQTGAYLVACFS
jgi:hypothetical protein